ncbi:MAG: glycosyltransferase domain-containing protein [Pseudomonadota bacterium]
MPKTALPSDLLLVLGPHRSGSSALTRAMSLVGYGLPKTLIKDNASNRRGHWECQPIVRRNEDYMQDADLVWADWVSGTLPKVPAQCQRDFEADLTAIIADEFKAGAPAVLKDPRLCRLVPRYRAALEGKTTLQVVIAVRNPLEVMRSLMLRNNLSEGHAALLWLRYMLDAVEDSHGLPRAFVAYDALLADPGDCLAGVQTALGQEFPHNINAVKGDVEAFLNATFRHQLSNSEDLMHNDLTHGLISECHDALRVLTQDAQDGHALQTLRDLSAQLNTSEHVLGHVLTSYDADLAEMRRQTATATAASDLRREQITALRDHHRTLQESEASLRREVKRLRARSAELEAEAASHLHNYLAVTHSTLWRLTRPLRSILSRLRGGGAAPREVAVSATPRAAEAEDEKPRPRATAADIACLNEADIFDADFYVAQHPEALRDPDGPAAHYLNTGWRKGFDPSRTFVTQAYEHSHADLLEADDCPALHFLDRYAPTYAKIRAPKDASPRIAVFSAIVGAYDDMKEPTVPVDGVDFFMFTDGAVPPGSIWQKRGLDYVDADPTRSARFVKTHPHLYFADYDYAIWMDANLALNAHPRDLLAMVDADKPVHSWKHPLRICVFEEARTCMELNKDELETVEADLARLRAEGFPRHAGLIETSVVVTTMAHPGVTKLYTEWWARIDGGSRRDQLSLPPACRAAGVEIGHIAPSRICMRTDPRIIYERHSHNERERLLLGQAA